MDDEDPEELKLLIKMLNTEHIPLEKMLHTDDMELEINSDKNDTHRTIQEQKVGEDESPILFEIIPSILDAY